jgi:UDPglucose 6-dehydrogenase
MVRPVIVDLRNIYRADEMKRANFRYLTVGRPAEEHYAESALPRRRKANARSTARERRELAH